MAFTVRDFQDLLHVLDAHPEWQTALRNAILKDDFLQLPGIVRELAEAQKRTEQKVEELAEAQKRTEQRMEELAVEIQKLRRDVTGLSATFGATLEEEAGSVLETVMRQKGYLVLEEAGALRFNGDVDIVLPVEAPDGRQLWVLMESKARLGRKDVQAWAQRVRSEGWLRRLAAAGCPGPYLVYVYAIRTDVSAREAIVETGLGLLKADGEIIPPAGQIEA